MQISSPRPRIPVLLLQSPRIDDEADPITRCNKHEAQSECIPCGCTLTAHIGTSFYPTLSNGITLHRLSSDGSGGSGSGLAVAVSMKPPIFSAAPLCISLVMCV